MISYEYQKNEWIDNSYTDVSQFFALVLTRTDQE